MAPNVELNENANALAFTTKEKALIILSSAAPSESEKTVSFLSSSRALRAVLDHDTDYHTTQTHKNSL
jgi:hypothetical protein